jgi:long-chain acyl-CoA synthetase
MRTIINLFEESVRKYPDNIYLWQKDKEKYEGTSYRKTYELVYTLAAGLMKSGLEFGDRVVLLSEGRNDWVVSELSILYNGAINVPLSIKLNEPEEIAFRLKHSGAKMAIASGRQIQKILDVADQAPDLKLIICLDDFKGDNKKVITKEQVISDGKELLATDPESFYQRFKSIKENDFANICYTSGTTADPKGIILSHRNYTANVEQLSSLYDIPSWYTTLLILPWDHSFAHTCGIYAKMKYGASLASIELGSSPMETLKNIPKNIKEVRPVFLLSVPSLAKNFRKNIEKAIQDRGGIIEKLFYHALHIAYVYNGIGWDRGKGFKKILWPLLKLYDLVIFKKVREAFGGRLKFFVGGGALLDIELQRFFYAIGIPMYQGYGLTEASPVISSNNPDKTKMGSSGTLVSPIEIKICDDNGNELPTNKKGEIVIRGENIMMGYWKNDSATKEALRNGWLHTGDLGYLDQDNFLYVLGRFKSLLIADDGEKFSPEGIEEAFADNSSFIEQCMMYNNQRPYSVCLLVINKEAVRKYLAGEQHAEEKKSELVLKKIEAELGKYRKGGEFETMFPQRWLPSAIGILSEGFTEENHLMNSTLKMVRPKITERYQDLLNFLYTPEAKSILNERNITEIVKLIS